MQRNIAIQIIRKVRKDYNTIAKEWEQSRFRPSKLKIKLVQRVMPGAKVLDAGCGNGLIVEEALKRGAVYIGVDFSDDLIKLAKKRFKKEIKEKRAVFKKANVLKLPFRAESFDFVISFAVAHHIPSDKLRLQFFKELHKLLKPGGEAIITVWNLLNEWTSERYKVNEQLEHPPTGLQKGDLLIPWKGTKGKVIDRYVHLFFKEELQKLAREAGFTSAKIDFYTKQGEKKKNGEEMVLYARTSSQ